MAHVNPELVDSISKFAYKKLSKNHKPDKKSEIYLKKIKSDKELRKKLDKYDMYSAFIMILLWVISIFLSLILVKTYLPVLDTNKINFFIITFMICWITLMISLLGPFYYLSGFIMKNIFKILNPKLDSDLLKNYTFKMFDKKFAYSNTNLGLNTVPVNNLVAKWMTIITIIDVIIIILLIPFLV